METTSKRSIPLPEPSDQIEEGCRNLREFGLTIHKNFLSADEARKLRERLLEQARLEVEMGCASFAYAKEQKIKSIVGTSFAPYIGKPEGEPPFQRVPFLVNKGRGFIELANHPVALAYAKSAFAGERFNITIQNGLIVRNGVPAQTIHMDQAPVPFQTPIPVSIVVMVALSDFEEDMGATRFIPGSHKRHPEDEGRDPYNVSEAETVAATMNQGDALIFEGRCWHGQGASTSDKPRYSILTGYGIHFLKPMDNFPALIHDDVYERMTSEERALYGFDFFGYGGRIGPRSPSDSRQNINDPMPYIPELHT